MINKDYLFREVRLGLKNLVLHKLRSVLTILGVVFGVCSVVAMLAIGEGASQEALAQIRMLGSHNIIIHSAKPLDEETASNVRVRMSVYGLTYEDEQRILETFDTVKRSVPAKLIRKQGRLNGRLLELRVVGTTPAWFELVQRELSAGRVIVPSDLERRRNVVVLTEYGARRILATENTIGTNLRIGSDVFEVIGIIRNETVSIGGFQAPDQEVDAYIPINIARTHFGDLTVKRSSGSRTREWVELHQMIVEVHDLDDVESTAKGIEAMLERFHKKKDYRISVPLALLRQAEATKRTFTIVLGSIAGISLLVGGIGIMNIMLASVTERTREIGIRRAIGAKRHQIITQFLIETVVLSTFGGLIGILIGLAIPYLVTHFTGMNTAVRLYSLVLALGISMGVGVVFGLYPARRAANLDPIQALRHE